MDKTERRINILIQLMAREQFVKKLEREQKQLERLNDKAFAMTEGYNHMTSNAKFTQRHFRNENRRDVIYSNIRDYKAAIQIIDNNIKMLKS